MNAIILDMEWNQPQTREMTVLSGPPNARVPLYGEIIRIGAVRMTENGAEDSFHISVVPRFYRRMNSSVRKVTGLQSSSLKKGVTFPEAYEQFINWCGKDACFFTWGSEDERVLHQNLSVHKMGRRKVPKFYDLQLVFAYKIIGDGRLKALAKALEYYSLDTELKAHDALNDAIYAARVAEKMDFFSHIDGYDSMIEEALRQKSEKYRHTFVNVPSAEHALENRRIMSLDCPVCTEKMEHSGWVSQKEGVIITCCRCTKDGEYFLRIRMKKCPDGKYSVTRSMCRLSEEYRMFYSKMRSENGEFSYK